MRAIVQRARACRTAEVEVGGMLWRIRALDSTKVSQHRLHLLHVGLPTEEQLVEEDAINTMPAAEQPAARARLAARRAREVGPAQLAEAFRREQDMVIAGVTHGHDGEGWQELAVVDGASTDDALGIDDLAPGTVQELAAAIWSLSTDGGRAAERLRGFRRGP